MTHLYQGTLCTCAWTPRVLEFNETLFNSVYRLNQFVTSSDKGISFNGIGCRHLVDGSKGNSSILDSNLYLNGLLVRQNFTIAESFSGYLLVFSSFHLSSKQVKSTGRRCVVPNNSPSLFIEVLQPAKFFMPELTFTLSRTGEHHASEM